MMHAARDNERIISMHELDKRLEVVEIKRENSDNRLTNIERDLKEVKEMLLRLTGAADLKDKIWKIFYSIISLWLFADGFYHLLGMFKHA